jgi:ABC-2 type transport system permease protein
MAVYKRTYKGYAGALTAEWSRFLVIPRFAWRGLLSQKFLTIFYALCFFYPLGCAVAIYLNNNLGFLGQYMPVPKNGLFDVGGKFFWIYTNVQGAFAFILTAFIGPGLISPDLSNGALPLYFCRPFSRFEYVSGKMIVLLGALSNITWIPGLLLFGLQSGIAEDGWFSKNLWLAGSIVLSSMVWIVLICVLSLALSAWVRWRIVAGALMLVVFFLLAGMAQAVNAVMRTDKGYWLDPATNIERVSMVLFGMDLPDEVSSGESIMCLIVLSAFCIWLLSKKVRAFEVVR